MDFRPRTYRRKAGSRSYPKLVPHITLATFNCPAYARPSLDTVLPHRTMEALVASFGKLRRGDSYRGAMGITIVDNLKLTELRDRVRHNLMEHHDLETKSGRFPHVSLFYVDEDEERDRLERHIWHYNLVRKTQSGVALTCRRPDGTVVEMTGFTGEEVWLMDCNPSDANEWRVLDKRLVTRNSTSPVVREDISTYLGSAGQTPVIPTPTQSSREERSDRAPDWHRQAQVQLPTASPARVDLTFPTPIPTSFPLVSRRRAYSAQFSVVPPMAPVIPVLPAPPQNIVGAAPNVTSTKTPPRPSPPPNYYNKHSPSRLPQTPVPASPNNLSPIRVVTEAPVVTHEANLSRHDKHPLHRHSSHDLKPKAPALEAQLEADNICLICRQRVKRRNYQFCSPRCTVIAAQRAPELIPVPRGHVMYNDGMWSLHKIYLLSLTHMSNDSEAIFC